MNFIVLLTAGVIKRAISSHIELLIFCHVGNYNLIQDKVLFISFGIAVVIK